MRERLYYVYILTNPNRTVLYVGVTNDISRRLTEHRNGTGDSFTKRYRVYLLVHLERFTSIYGAISREKQLKSGSRRKKLEVVRTENPELEDLSYLV